MNLNLINPPQELTFDAFKENMHTCALVDQHYEMNMLRKIYPGAKIDQKIVEGVQKHFCHAEKFNPAFIFYSSFEISYKKFEEKERDSSLTKVSLFLFQASQFANLHNIQIPKEIISQILIHLVVPTREKFQCEIFKNMDQNDTAVIKEIKANILPPERNIEMYDIVSYKGQESSCTIQ